MMKISLFFALIGGTLLSLGRQAPAADTTTADAPELSYATLMTITEPTAQQLYSMRLKERFDVFKSGEKNPLEDELLGILRNPQSGYHKGRIIASILGASRYDKYGAIDACPLVDESSRFKNRYSDLAGLGVLRYCAERHYLEQQQRPDILFVYWKQRVFELPSKAFRGADGVDFSHALLWNVREDNEKPGETWLELWLLETTRRELKKILDMTLSKGATHAGSYENYYGVDWASQGRRLSDIDAYYREDVPASQRNSRCHAIANDVVSPYFIFRKYSFDKATGAYREVEHQKIEGAEYLIRVSRMTNEDGRVNGYSGPQGVKALLHDFMLYDPDPVAGIIVAYSSLKPSIQQTLTVELGESLGDKKIPINSIEDLKANAEVLKLGWKRYVTEVLCKMP